MIFTYNKEHVGDVLMVIVADGQGVKLAAERKGNVARKDRGDEFELETYPRHSRFLRQSEERYRAPTAPPRRLCP